MLRCEIEQRSLTCHDSLNEPTNDGVGLAEWHPLSHQPLRQVRGGEHF
jgi:hypothetical protein